MTVNGEYRKALKDLGPLTAQWSEVDKLFYCEYDVYPAVMHAAATEKEAIEGYKKALREWIQERMAGNVAEFMDKATSGRGGARPGAGRPRRTPTIAVRIPDDILDVVNWLREDPERAEQVRRFMQA